MQHVLGRLTRVGGWAQAPGRGDTDESLRSTRCKRESPPIRHASTHYMRAIGRYTFVHILPVTYLPMRHASDRLRRSSRRADFAFRVRCVPAHTWMPRAECRRAPPHGSLGRRMATWPGGRWVELPSPEPRAASMLGFYGNNSKMPSVSRRVPSDRKECRLSCVQHDVFRP